MVKRTGLHFYVTGEFVHERDYVTGLDPSSQNWKDFDNEDLHPFGKKTFTAWCQFDEVRDSDLEEMVDQIVAVVDWLRLEKDWTAFVADLWWRRGPEKKDEKVFSWNLP